MSVINTGSITSALRPGVRAWFGNMYKRYPEEFSQIFDVLQSNMNYEKDVNIHGFGLGVVKPEGSGVTYSTLQQGFKKTYQHITYALGFQLTEEAIADNLYMKLAKDNSEKLALSMKQVKENVGANVLNRAFNSSYTGADGLELCSRVHLLSRGGTFANEPASATDLSESSLEQAVIDISKFKDDASINMQCTAQMLIIPPDQEFEACRILNSPQRVATADNDINALKYKGYLPQGYIINHYLTDTDAWFVKTDAPNGLLHFVRKPLVIDSDMDFDTNNVRFKAVERYSFGWTDPRCIYGSPGV